MVDRALRRSMLIQRGFAAIIEASRDGARDPPRNLSSVAKRKSVADRKRSFYDAGKNLVGYSYPLGADWLGKGVKFAIFFRVGYSVRFFPFYYIDAAPGKLRI